MAMNFGDDARPHDPQAPIPFRPQRRDLAPYGAAGMVHAYGELEEDGGGINVLHYLHVFLKWKWVIGGAVAIAVLVGLVATMLTTPLYRASSTIRIDREAAKVLNTDGVQPRETGSGDEFYQTEYGMLRSRHLAERVVTKFNLADNAAFLNQGHKRSLLRRGGSDVMKLDRARRIEIATSMVQNGLAVEPIRPSRLVRLTYSSPDGQLAAVIANDVAETYLEDNLQRRFAANDYARNFLRDKLEQTRQKLEQSENALIAYERSQQIINMPSRGGPPGSGGDASTTSLQAQNLSMYSSALAEATNQRVLAEQRWRGAVANPKSVTAEVAQSQALQTLRDRRVELVNQYQQNLAEMKPAFPAMQALKARIDEMDKAIAAEQSSARDDTVTVLQQRYETALKQEQQLSGKVEALKASFLDLRTRSVQYNILARDAEQTRAQYQDLLERSKTISVAGAIDANNISIIDRALPSSFPFQPRPMANMLMALGLGLVVGVGLALLLEQLDDSIKSPEDVDSKLGVPLLGAIPILSKGTVAAEALSDPRSAVSEAYYSVRTALQFSTSEGAPANLLVTSARPSEGKSTTAMALAQNFARLGLRTLLIDSDLRNPSLHKVLGRHNSAGLSNLLTGSQTLAELMQPTDDPNMMFLACGPLPPNPAELLAGARARQVLQEVGEQFDQIIIDGPPVMGLADAPLLSSVAAGTVMVVAANSTRRGLARAAIKRLNLSHARLLGVILTKFNARRTSYGYGYGSTYAYSYDYGAKDEPEPKRLGVGDLFRRRGPQD